MSNNRFGGDSIIIRSLLLQQTGTFHDVYNRSFYMETDDNAIESVRKRLQAVGSGRVTSKSFRGISAGLLVPKAEVDSRRDRIVIPDGWDRSRCRFMMEVEVETRLGDVSNYFFQGFTDHLGLSRSGHIDEDMEFYINGFIRVQYATRSTARGRERFGIVKESAQVIDGKLVFDRNEDTRMMRTVDLYANMQERFYENEYTESLGDSRTSLTSPVDSIFAKRADNLPGEYLSSAIDTYRRNTDLVSFGTGTEDILARTQQELNADLMSMSDNPFLRRLAQVKGMHSATHFTLRDLFDIDPDAQRSGVIEGIDLDSQALRQLAHIGNDVSDWRAATTEARWATQISNALSAIMMGNYYRGLKFSASNMNFDQRIIVLPEDGIAVAENMPDEIFDRMIDQIEDLFFDMSGGNRDEFEVQVSASLYDQTEIFVSVNNSREQRFFVPSFADSLMSPFYTRDKNDLTNLSSDIESLINELSGEITGSSSALSIITNI